MEETSWYLGSEPKRGAPYNLNITFIPKNEEVILTVHIQGVYMYILYCILYAWVQKFSSVKTLYLLYAQVRTKEQPLFGRVMSFSSRELFVK